MTTREDALKSDEVLGQDGLGRDVTVKDVVNAEGWDGPSQLAEAARALVDDYEEETVDESPLGEVGTPVEEVSEQESGEAEKAAPVAQKPVPDQKWANDGKDL